LPAPFLIYAVLDAVLDASLVGRHNDAQGKAYEEKAGDDKLGIGCHFWVCCCFFLSRIVSLLYDLAPFLLRDVTPSETDGMRDAVDCICAQAVVHCHLLDVVAGA
jgi:hypothetical protein